MGHKHGADLVSGPDALQLDVQAAPGDGIECAERFVEQQYLRLEDQRPGDRRPLAHASGELTGPGLGEVGEADELEELLYPLIVDGPSGHVERDRDVGVDGGPGQQRVVLEGNAEALPVGHRQRAPASEGDRARCGLL